MSQTTAIRIKPFRSSSVDEIFSLDGATPLVVNSTVYTFTPGVPLFTATNLPDGPHVVEFTNLPTANRSLFAIDYAVVNTSMAVSTNATSSTSNGTTSVNGTSGANGTSASGGGGTGASSAGAIAGGVVGGVVGVLLIAFLLWFFCIRRNGRSYGTKKKYTGPIDLDGEPSDPSEFGISSSGYPLTRPEMQSTTQGAFASRQSSGARQNTFPNLATGAQEATPFLSSVPPPPLSSNASYAQPQPAELRGPKRDPSSPSCSNRSNTSPLYTPASSSSRAGDQKTPTLGIPQSIPEDTGEIQQTPISAYRPTSSFLGTSSTSTPETPEIPESGPESLKSAVMSLPFTARRPVQAPPPTPASPLPPVSIARMSRFSVSGREIDMGPVGEEHDEYGDLLPPDYRQATQPLPGQSPGNAGG